MALKDEDKLVDEALEAWEAGGWEQLDELSKKTLGSYIKSAAVSGSIHHRRSYTDDKDKVVSAKRADHNRKWVNRLDGIRRATDKLTKEQLEELDALTEGKVEEFMAIEESAASETVRPQNKSTLMRDLLSKVAGMSVEDATHFFNDAIANVANYGKGVPDGASAKNQASIKMKGDAKGALKEDIAGLFEGQEGLDEEFITRTTDLFEAAVEQRLIIITEELNETFAERLAEEVGEIRGELTEKIDAFLELVVEQWKEDNKVAIESSLRTEATLEFIEGLKGLFQEHNINLPEDQVDAVEAMQEEVTKLQGLVEELTVENHRLKESETDEELETVFDAISEGMTMTDVERFRTLVEALDFDGDVDAYKTKLLTVKEHYFKKPVGETGILSESFEEEASQETTTKTVDSDPAVQRYVDALSRQVKTGR